MNRLVGKKGDSKASRKINTRQVVPMTNKKMSRDKALLGYFNVRPSSAGFLFSPMAAAGERAAGPSPSQDLDRK